MSVIEDSITATATNATRAGIARSASRGTFAGAMFAAHVTARLEAKDSSMMISIEFARGVHGITATDAAANTATNPPATRSRLVRWASST